MEDNKKELDNEKLLEEDNVKKDINSNGLEEIEDDKQEIENKFGIDSELETVKEKPTSIDERKYQIEARLQELEILIDALDIKLEKNDDNFDEYYEQYDSAKKEMNALIKEKKLIIKQERSKEEKTVLDNISIWVILYGALQIIICLPGLSYSLWLRFASWLINTFSNTLDKITRDDWLYYPLMSIIIYALPLLLNLLTLELYINFIKPKKNKTNKIAFIIFWMVQLGLTIFMMIYLGIKIFGR